MTKKKLNYCILVVQKVGVVAATSNQKVDIMTRLEPQALTLEYLMVRILMEEQ